MDLDINESAYRKKGYNFTIDEKYRFGIRVVNEKTKDDFLEKIQPYMISADELREMMSMESDPDELLSYNPSILIDFENKLCYHIILSICLLRILYLKAGQENISSLKILYRNNTGSGIMPKAT